MSGLQFTHDELMELAGKVFIAKDGLVYTGTSASTHGVVTVFDPRANEYLHFDSRGTFNNWAFGTPVPSAYPANFWRKP